MCPTMERRRTLWPNIRDDLAKGTICTVSDLDGALMALARNPPSTSWFDSLEEMWNKPDSTELLDYLLGWGTVSFRFCVIRQAIMRFSERKREHHMIQSGAAQLLRIEELEGNDQPFELAPEILAERILQKDPQVLSELDGRNNGEGNSLLHYAIEYDVEKVVNVILKIFKDNNIEDLERLLVESSEIRESPFMILIKKNKSLGLAQKILQALPALKIDNSILGKAIDLKRDEFLLFLTTIRPDCVTIELLNYCISFHLKDVFDDILKTRNDLLYGNGLLQSAMRRGDAVIIEMLLKACPGLSIEYEDGMSPLQCFQQRDVEAVLDESSRQHIRSIIVSYIVRTAKGQLLTDGAGRISPTEQIRRLLSQPEDKRREISLDLGGFRHSSKFIEPFLEMIKGLSITPNPKTTSLLTVEFETTLRYVDIPVPPIHQIHVNQQSIPERLEAKLVLNWLRESKVVAGIYELRVRDLLYLPHSEEAIFQSSDGFDIEVLDWMRPDMSARPLVKSCSRLKKLTLYVSTWASLSYWVSGDGYVHLNEFHELRIVEIFILTDLIGPLYSSAYKQDGYTCEKKSRAKFEENNSPRKIQFIIKFYLKSWYSLTSRQPETPKVKKSTAVEATRLGPYIEAYALLQKEFQDPDFRAETHSEHAISPIINVAVIDTGVDPDSIQCFETCGASFVSSASGESPWWFSYHPHGTQMAKIITELNPSCRLLVAKVGDSVMDMTVDRVIQALEWAIKSGADIISISIASFKCDDRLQLAVQEAIRANIVVIAATAGEGYRQEKAYPANFSHVLSIAATDYWGKETPESLKEHADFMFPGENIIAETFSLGSRSSTDKVSGTSVATAIASGVASLILAAHRLSLSKLHSQVAREHHESLKLQIVKDVFTKMVDNNSAKFVKPWLFFGDSGDQTIWGEARSTMDWLSKKRFLK